MRRAVILATRSWRHAARPAASRCHRARRRPVHGSHLGERVRPDRCTRYVLVGSHRHDSRCQAAATPGCPIARYAPPSRDNGPYTLPHHPSDRLGDQKALVDCRNGSHDLRGLCGHLHDGDVRAGAPWCDIRARFRIRMRPLERVRIPFRRLAVRRRRADLGCDRGRKVSTGRKDRSWPYVDPPDIARSAYSRAALLGGWPTRTSPLLRRRSSPQGHSALFPGRSGPTD